MHHYRYPHLCFLLVFLTACTPNTPLQKAYENKNYLEAAQITIQTLQKSADPSTISFLKAHGDPLFEQAIAKGQELNKQENSSEALHFLNTLDRLITQLDQLDTPIKRINNYKQQVHTQLKIAQTRYAGMEFELGKTDYLQNRFAAAWQHFANAQKYDPQNKELTKYLEVSFDKAKQTIRIPRFTTPPDPLIRALQNDIYALTGKPKPIPTPVTDILLSDNTTLSEQITTRLIETLQSQATPLFVFEQHNKNTNPTSPITINGEINITTLPTTLQKQKSTKTSPTASVTITATANIRTHNPVTKKPENQVQITGTATGPLQDAIQQLTQTLSDQILPILAEPHL